MPFRSVKTHKLHGLCLQRLSGRLGLHGRGPGPGGFCKRAAGTLADAVLLSGDNLYLLTALSEMSCISGGD